MQLVEAGWGRTNGIRIQYPDRPNFEMGVRALSRGAE